MGSAQSGKSFAAALAGDFPLGFFWSASLNKYNILQKIINKAILFIYNEVK